MFLVQACSYKSKIDPNYYCQKLKFSCIQSNKVVNFKTSKDFTVKYIIAKNNIAAKTADPLKATHKKVKTINKLEK